jgi:hypothetical protein
VSDSIARASAAESNEGSETDRAADRSAEPAEVADPAANVDGDREGALTARLEVLAEENRRLRTEYARARRSRYQRSALGLGGLGLFCGIVALLVPGSRTVLFALAGTGLFAGLLTYFLAPERFLSAAVGRDVYTAIASNEAALAAELGLEDHGIYVPNEGTDPPAWLFVPQRRDYELPDSEALESLFVVTDAERSRGVSFRPTGAGLYEEFERALAEDPSGDPRQLADALCDALVEQFELVERATPDVDPENGRVSVAITASAYGSIERFDHPIGSLLGVALARALGTAVTVETRSDVDDDRADAVLTCTWEPV